MYDEFIRITQKRSVKVFQNEPRPTKVKQARSADTEKGVVRMHKRKWEIFIDPTIPPSLGTGCAKKYEYLKQRSGAPLKGRPAAFTSQDSPRPVSAPRSALDEFHKYLLYLLEQNVADKYDSCRHPTTNTSIYD
ncbi:hypothetical protein EVAR_83613_1 [Eumeta japonica]|uniref:Uncharacterized protein n=1 Tax=Eumeta variegata TaxID=151549 RepID=A0A4C1UPS9_EUMVA|nr:hypothetical protein EVAR_83613_1 [Eumeta japonica]